MPLENPEASERTANAVNFVFVETLAVAYALQLGNARLKLVPPLISKRSFNRKATVDGITPKYGGSRKREVARLVWISP